MRHKDKMWVLEYTFYDIYDHNAILYKMSRRQNSALSGMYFSRGKLFFKDFPRGILVQYVNIFLKVNYFPNTFLGVDYFPNIFPEVL